MKAKLAQILRKWADLIDPSVKPTTTNVGTLTVRVEADTQDFMKEMERVEQVVKRAMADFATLSAQASVKAIANRRARKPKAK
jgi:hypothetical protein